MKLIFLKLKQVFNSLIKRFKALSRKKKILVIGIAVILLLFVVPSIVNSTKPPSYESAIAKRDDITELVSETGTITVSGRADVQSPTNGVVKEVFVKNGDVVKKGDTLFTVESSATQEEAQAAYAAYLSAQSTLNAAEATAHSLRSAMYTEWKSFTDLSTNSTYETDDGKPKEQERGSAEFQSSQDDWLAAEQAYQDQVTAIGAAQAKANATRLAYQATQNATVKAPLAGKVSNLSVTVGSGVKVQTVASSPKPVLTISSEGKTEVVASLSESDIAKVAEGQEATIEVNAIDDKKYKGIVRRVDSIGTDDQGVVRYYAYIEVMNPDTNFRSGMTVDVDIVTNVLKNVLSVPNSAVKPYQGGRAVRIYDAMKREVVYKPVHIGVRGDSRTQILDGIEEGTEIITALANDQIQRPGLLGN